MEKITIISGDFFSTSGYASHTRNLCRALTELGADVKLHTNLIPNWEQFVNTAEMNMIIKDEGNIKERTAIVIGLPTVWYNILVQNYKKFLGYIIWEGNKIPQQWVNILFNKKIDGIIVPSEHTKNTIINTVKKTLMLPTDKLKLDKYIENKIYKIPHGVDLSLFQPEHKEHTDFIFIANSGWRFGMNDRKGIQYLLKAYFEEFTNKDNVVLILKLNPAYLNQGWDFHNECIKIGIKKSETNPKVFINLNAINYKEMKNLYNMGDVFISTTCADSFNIPCLEAMACGLPIITTNYGGQIDFVNENNGWIINEGRMKEISTELFYEGIEWKEPDVNAIRKVMRYVYEHPEEVKKKGQQALLDSKNFTWRNSAKRILEVIKG